MTDRFNVWLFLYHMLKKCLPCQRRRGLLWRWCSEWCEDYHTTINMLPTSYQPYHISLMWRLACNFWLTCCQHHISTATFPWCEDYQTTINMLPTSYQHYLCYCNNKQVVTRIYKTTFFLLMILWLENLKNALLMILKSIKSPNWSIFW